MSFIWKKKMLTWFLCNETTSDIYWKNFNQAWKQFVRKGFYAKLQQFDALFCIISIDNKTLYKYICTHKYKYTLHTSTHYTQRFYWYLKSIFWLSVKDWFWDPLSSTCCNLRYSFCMQPRFNCLETLIVQAQLY